MPLIRLRSALTAAVLRFVEQLVGISVTLRTTEPRSERDARLVAELDWPGAKNILDCSRRRHRRMTYTNLVAFGVRRVANTGIGVFNLHWIDRDVRFGSKNRQIRKRVRTHSPAALSAYGLTLISGTQDVRR